MRFTKKLTIAILIVVSFALGIFTTLNIDTIRYTAAIPPSPMVSIEPKEVYAEIEAKDPSEYLFYDVRTKDQFDLLHASLSNNVPIVDVYDIWPELPRDKDKKIYLICKLGRLAAVAYEFLQLHGFTNIVHVAGGIQQWSADGLPTVSPTLFPEKF